jgi:hypothetical protein
LRQILLNLARHSGAADSGANPVIAATGASPNGPADANQRSAEVAALKRSETKSTSRNSSGSRTRRASVVAVAVVAPGTRDDMYALCVGHYCATSPERSAADLAAKDYAVALQDLRGHQRGFSMLGVSQLDVGGRPLRTPGYASSATSQRRRLELRSTGFLSSRAIARIAT